MELCKIMMISKKITRVKVWGPAKECAGYAAFWRRRSYINHVFIFQTDCEHGKLAVTTSKNFSKIYENLKYTKAKIS